MTREQHLLTILAEECAEVAQRASKAIRFGMEEVQPNQGLTNWERLGDELNDLFAMAEMLGFCPFEPSIKAKIRKVEHYLGYSEKCGTLGIASLPTPEVEG